jgi:hypothetical protein
LSLKAGQLAACRKTSNTSQERYSVKKDRVRHHHSPPVLQGADKVAQTGRKRVSDVCWCLKGGENQDEATWGYLALSTGIPEYAQTVE